MSLSGRLSRTDRQPLGTLEQVQETLTHFFPDTRFVKITRPPLGTEDLKWPWWLRAWLFFFSEEVEYPHWHGSYEGDQFAIVFYLGPHPLVKVVRVTLYGGTPAAAPLFDALTRQTGWNLRYY